MLEISFAKPELPEKGVLVLPLAEGAEFSGPAAALDKALKGGLKRAIEAADFSGKTGQLASLLAPGTYKKILVIGAGKAEAPVKAEELGGAIAAACTKEGAVTVLAGDAEAAARLAFGARLRAYRFEKYRTTQKEDEKAEILAPDRAHPRAAGGRGGVQDPRRRGAWGGVHPRPRDRAGQYALPGRIRRTRRGLEKLGLKVEVFGQRDLEKLGFGTLLSVSQGSAREPRMVVLQWFGAAPEEEGKKGNKNLKEPIAFIGKGVTFDTGGISLKPSAGMEDMKWDMAGAAAVVGAMAALAGRKAKVDAVGLVGLVENMPSGTATRPGDVVKSLSGQTVEILNTDAEGRLVLADVLYYAQQRFAPKYMVDLATLTGAIITGLGHEYAGLFANDDELAAKLTAAGAAVGEKLWRMPLAKPGESYDKDLNSPIADVKNIGSRAGGSITAAQFLQRFVNGKPWAHLDIAGMAWADKEAAVTPKGATGFGVRLLDAFVRAFEG